MTMQFREIILCMTIITSLATAAWGVENGRIVFTVDDDVLAMNPDGNVTRRLADAGRKPKYSPDGTRIAFFVNNEIWIIYSNPILGAPSLVTSIGPVSAYRKVELSWSPDGDQIAFTCEVGICKVNKDGTNRTAISNDTRDDAPEWSPDGTRFLFLKRPYLLCNHECQPDIFVMNVDGTNQIRLTTRGGFTIFTGPVWSPDSTKVAYAYNFLGLILGITIMDANGADPRTLIQGDDLGGVLPTDPAWSPDGSKIAFAGQSSYTLETFVTDIYVIGQDGTNLRNVTRTPDIDERDPDWGIHPAARLVRTPSDFDGDGRTDISVFRPSTADWYIKRSVHGQMYMNYGLPGDRIVPADYDGDGRTDFAIYRPSQGGWYIVRSSDGASSWVYFGLSTDRPMPADYDGDGRADICVFRPSTGIWYKLNSSNGAFSGLQFGLSDDQPTVGDFDGDGKADIAVFRPSSGVWYQLRSGTGSIYSEQFGVSTDKPVPADWDGDGRTDIAVYRESPTGSSLWFVRYSFNEASFVYPFGSAGDVPVPGNYDISDAADYAVFRPSTGRWYIRNGGSGSITTLQWGQNGDVPTPSLGVLDFLSEHRPSDHSILTTAFL